MLTPFDDVEVSAGLARPGNVFDQAGEESGVVGAGVAHRQAGARVGRPDPELVRVLDLEAVPEPLDGRRRRALERHTQRGRLALLDAHWLKVLGEAGTGSCLSLEWTKILGYQIKRENDLFFENFMPKVAKVEVEIPRSNRSGNWSHD